jgi:hypothetical protein
MEVFVAIEQREKGVTVHWDFFQVMKDCRKKAQKTQKEK